MGRGIFIPSGLDPDTFVRERGAAAFAELTEKSQLLVDYFLSEQATEARGSIAERARAAKRVAEMLKLVGDSVPVRPAGAQGGGPVVDWRGSVAQGGARRGTRR